MTDDRMHDRLTRAGADWQREQQPPEPDLDAVTRPRSRVPTYAAAAAAVLAIAGGGWAVGQLGHTVRPTPPSATPTLPQPSPGVVPWADLPPTHPTIPTHRVATRFDPAAVAALPPCSADDLDVSSSTEGAAGTTYLNLEIYGPDDPCRLEGVPQVRLLDRGTQIPAFSSQVGHTKLDPVQVDREDSATLSIGWAVGHSCAGVDNDKIRITLPDGSWFSTEGFGPTSCNPGESDLAELTVEPFQRGTFVSARRVSVFDSIRARPASGKAFALEGSPGQHLEFTVRLDSPVEVALDPCPDYRIQLYYGDYGLSEEHEYALNCDAIPTRDSRGRPVLLPGRPVDLQMFVTAPDTDVPKLLWVLDGVRPDRSHAGGEISVS